MRHLLFTNYESGRSGLSNGIMSIECGVVLAFLTNRMLVLEGNVPPPANIVSYGGQVVNDTMSRVTDLIELPVPWCEPDAVELAGVPARELSDQHLGDMVYYAPSSLDIASADARAFARGRTAWLTADGPLVEVPLLRVTEQPVVLHEGRHRNNLSFYSYLFYLDPEIRRSVYRLLRRMRPKAPLAELASRVAADLGPFNAVHLRRGDFKVTYGVTTLERQPWEAIEAMDEHFRRDQLLVILTDERDDPFFAEITAAYPRHVFIDHHILDEYGGDFDQLPTRDSLTLAYLSQLVAAESADFIGTMTSTFTAIIQRYRGNRGAQEPFKFIWNELPDPSHRIERGRHPVSDCVPLDRGVMVEEHDGPYSWNRVSQRLNPAWMREWPESFLSEEVLETGVLPDHVPAAGGETRRPRAAALGPEVVHIPFDGLRIAVRPSSSRLAAALLEGFSLRSGDIPANAFAELEVCAGEETVVKVNGRPVPAGEGDRDVLRTIKLEMARLLDRARPHYAWLAGTAFVRDGRALVVVGDLGREDGALADAVCSTGWDLLWDEVVPVRVASGEVVPFGRSSWPTGASARPAAAQPVPLGAVIVAAERLTTRDGIARLTPAVAVAEMIGSSLDFSGGDRDQAVTRLCRLVEGTPVYQLSFSGAARAAALLAELSEWPAGDGRQEAEVAH